MEKLKIVLGSKNPSKLNALKEVLSKYEMFSDAQIEGLEVDSGVSDQPMSLNEVITGAKNRAKEVFSEIENCNFGFGLESGFMEVPTSKTGYLQFTVCAIYNGEEFHLGFSPAFECPHDIMDKIINQNMNLSDAALASGYSEDKELYKKQGIIGVLTKGKMDRAQYTSPAIIMAMVHIDKVK